MVTEHGRGGRAAGAGFYVYSEGKKVGLWRGLKDSFGGDNLDIPFKDLQERMLFAEAVESIRCLDESVLRTGGGREHRLDLRHRLPAVDRWVLQFVNTYQGVGPATLVAPASRTPRSWRRRPAALRPRLCWWPSRRRSADFRPVDRRAVAPETAPIGTVPGHRACRPRTGASSWSTSAWTSWRPGPSRSWRMDEVAAEAGVSRTLVFHYFPSKGDYFAAVVASAPAIG